MPEKNDPAEHGRRAARPRTGRVSVILAGPARAGARPQSGVLRRGPVTDLHAVR